MKFLFLMLGLPGDPNADDAQTQAYNLKWREYMSSLGRRGALTKLATPDVYGFMVVNAASLDEAIAMAREASHMALGGQTIVRPCVDVPR